VQTADKWTRPSRPAPIQLDLTTSSIPPPKRGELWSRPKSALKSSVDFRRKHIQVACSSDTRGGELITQLGVGDAQLCAVKIAASMTVRNLILWVWVTGS